MNRPFGERCVKRLQIIAESDSFDAAITSVVIINCLVIAAQTGSYTNQFIPLAFNTIDGICLAIYVFELFIKFVSQRLSFFRSGWNWFDLIIVVAALIPTSILPLPTQVGRILRVFRATRALLLVSAFQPLRMIVESIFKSLPNIAWTMVLLSVISYIYGIVGFYLYGQSFPEYFGNLPRTFFTLFQLTTMENWADVAREVMSVDPWAAVFFISYILLGAFIVVNVIIAIIVNAMEEVARETRREQITSSSSIEKELENIQRSLDSIRVSIADPDETARQ